MLALGGAVLPRQTQGDYRASYFSRLFEAILSPTLYDTGSLCARVKILCPLFPQIFGAVSVLQPLMMQFAVVRLCTPLASLPFLRRAARLLTAFARQWICRVMLPSFYNTNVTATLYQTQVHIDYRCSMLVKC